jgi:hypothetical protein
MAIARTVNDLSIAPARQVEISHEDVARIEAARIVIAPPRFCTIARIVIRRVSSRATCAVAGSCLSHRFCERMRTRVHLALRRRDGGVAGKHLQLVDRHAVR